MEYNFDVVYWAGKEHVVPYFLSRIYLVNMTVSEGMEEDCQVAAEKNKVYIRMKTKVGYFRAIGCTQDT